ncbi:hypothetical protein NE237_010971 [Protea cynaroides]|uniref:Uncharacterized protein n=1 Tax=Protea cynaroides TaxID=273540 RepID=A0A9Q0L1A1_9MAGN|nr:hypothetical protein NE237_010971 [Protea cynaroides]
MVILLWSIARDNALVAGDNDTVIEALFSTRFKSVSVDTWHKRLGHPQNLVFSESDFPLKPSPPSFPIPTSNVGTFESWVEPPSSVSSTFVLTNPQSPSTVLTNSQSSPLSLFPDPLLTVGTCATELVVSHNSGSVQSTDEQTSPVAYTDTVKFVEYSNSGPIEKGTVEKGPIENSSPAQLIGPEQLTGTEQGYRHRTSYRPSSEPRISFIYWARSISKHSSDNRSSTN